MYTRLTEINNMFGIQVQYLEFFRYFYQNQVFEIMLFIWTFLVAFYFTCMKCKDTPKKLVVSDIDAEFQKEKLQFAAKGDNKA